jgi:hypothetical protein
VLFTLLLAATATANAQETPTPGPVVETETVNCTAEVVGFPAFSAYVDVAFTIYDGDPEYTILGFSNARGTVADDGDDTTWYFLTDYTGGGQLAPEGPPNVVVDGSATMVRLRWSWELALAGIGVGAPGWYADGRTPVSCSETTYVGI